MPGTAMHAPGTGSGYGQTHPQALPYAPGLHGQPLPLPQRNDHHPYLHDSASGLMPHLHTASLAPMGPQSEQSFGLDRPLREARDAFEKSYFEFHLSKENGSMTRVAEKTGLERTHLYRKLKQLGVDLSRNKRGGPL